MPSKSNYVCLSCQKEMRRLRSGVVVEEHRENDLPYKIWSADVWECPICKYLCLLGFGDYPLTEHFKDDYADMAKSVEFHIR